MYHLRQNFQHIGRAKCGQQTDSDLGGVEKLAQVYRLYVQSLSFREVIPRLVRPMWVVFLRCCHSLVHNSVNFSENSPLFDFFIPVAQYPCTLATRGGGGGEEGSYSSHLRFFSALSRFFSDFAVAKISANVHETFLRSHALTAAST